MGEQRHSRELLVMFAAYTLSVLALASVGSAQLPDHLKALCPAYPNCDNALLAAYDKIYKAGLAPAGEPQAPVPLSQAALPCPNYPFCDVNHVALAQRGKRQASVPVTPGNVAGLVPGSPAAAAWWAAKIAHAGQLAHHVGKRQASVPVTPGNVAGLVPGSPAA